MAFLDNSGDIILDVVLTDEGRRRLARGDGSFRVVKFALGDDEINYSLYDKNNIRFHENQAFPSAGILSEKTLKNEFSSLFAAFKCLLFEINFN